MKDQAGSCCLPQAKRGTAQGGTAAAIPETRAFSSEGMILLAGGSFLMGSEGREIWPQDGEGPARAVSLDAFWIDECAVTSGAFEAFVAATGYVTEAENFGWSFVHSSQLSGEERGKRKAFRVQGLEWWYRVDGADWRHPLTPEVSVREMRRLDHPAVHLAWSDAAAYARWCGKRLPTEAEWEYASRGGLEQKIYPWGDELTPGGKHRCNIWQGEFPKKDRGEDGYRGTAPARSFKPNGYGLYNMTGNVWEWVNDWFDPDYAAYGVRTNPPGPNRGETRVMRGGSYLCHASYCNRYRCSARTANTPDTSSGHLGFRCAADGQRGRECPGTQPKSGVEAGTPLAAPVLTPV
ncbi:MAG: formylglycine-generating enzyme family protein [Verrucomicrobiota bacterium]